MSSQTPRDTAVRVRIAGGGDAFGSGSQFQTCFVVDDSHGRFAIDFGATSMVALGQLGIDPATIDLVLLSHLHGDHFGGVPFLLLHRQFATAITTPLTLAGPPGLEMRLRQLMEAMYPGVWDRQWRFAIHFIETAPDETANVLGRQILPRIAQHAAGDQPCLSLRISTDGRVIAFSGDTGWHEGLVDLARGSDLFICECNERYDQPYDTHISFQTLSQHIHRLETRRLLLCHLGPDMVTAVDELPVQAAAAGLTIEL